MNNEHNSNYALLTNYISHHYLHTLSYTACTAGAKALLNNLANKYRECYHCRDCPTGFHSLSEAVYIYATASYVTVSPLSGKVVVLPEDASPEEKLVLLLEARIRNPLEQLHATCGKEEFTIPLRGICNIVSDAELGIQLFPFFESWEHFSGSMSYPVSSDPSEDGSQEYNDTPYRYFWDQERTYGKLRASLARHIITCLKEIIRNNSHK